MLRRRLGCRLWRRLWFWFVSFFLILTVKLLIPAAVKPFIGDPSLTGNGFLSLYRNDNYSRKSCCGNYRRCNYKQITSVDILYRHIPDITLGLLNGNLLNIFKKYAAHHLIEQCSHIICNGCILHLQSDDYICVIYYSILLNTVYLTPVLILIFHIYGKEKNIIESVLGAAFCIFVAQKIIYNFLYLLIVKRGNISNFLCILIFYISYCDIVGIIISKGFYHGI